MALSALPDLFRKGVAQPDGAVEHGMIRGRILVPNEVALTFELHDLR